MFGYVKPDLPYLYLKDDKLYKALYCGVCKSIGKNLGQRARLSLTYDIAFLSATVHNLKGVDVQIKNERCIAHSVISRPMASRDEITSACAAANVTLAYYKIKDDIIDSGKGRVKLLFFAKAHKRALKEHAEISEIVERNYEGLRTAEKNAESRIDAVSDHFSLMMKEISDYMLGEKADEYTGNLFYFLGKWIYLIDALDDYDKDVKKGNYNPFYFAYGNKSTIGELIEENGNEVAYIFADIFAQLKVNSENCRWGFNHDLIDNILLRGLPDTTMKIISKTKEAGK